MYEFHGWIRLAESTREIDEGGLESKNIALKNFIKDFRWDTGKVEVVENNGLYTLIVNAIPNRRRNESEDLDMIIQYITKNYSGAYGVIYEYDEQTEVHSGRGVFTVRVIRRGEHFALLDPFLSPIVPNVEDF